MNNLLYCWKLTFYDCCIFVCLYLIFRNIKILCEHSKQFCLLNVILWTSKYSWKEKGKKIIFHWLNCFKQVWGWEGEDEIIWHDNNFDISHTICNCAVTGTGNSKKQPTVASGESRSTGASNWEQHRHKLQLSDYSSDWLPASQLICLSLGWEFMQWLSICFQ